jgi:hypothetical protein
VKPLENSPKGKALHFQFKIIKESISPFFHMHIYQPVLSAALIGCLRARVAAAAIIIAAVPTTGFTYCQCLLIFIHQIPI